MSQQDIYVIVFMSVGVLAGVAGILRHIVDEYRRRHHAALIYGPLVICGIIGFGLWISSYLLSPVR